MLIKRRNKPYDSELQNKGSNIAVEKWRFKTALIALATSIISVFATASVINLNINTDIPLTVNKALVEAQDMYYSEKYTEALSLYQEFVSESGIASLNLGYMYSKGLGCKRDFEMACQYYKQAYSLGIEEGLDNYLAVNLLYPNSYEDTLEALRFGVENKHTSAIRYVAFLESDMLFTSVNDNVYEYAGTFLKQSLYNQLEMLEGKSVEISQKIEYIEKGNVVENSDFKKYSHLNETIKGYISHYTTEIVSIDGRWVETIVPVHDIKMYDLYSVEGMNFECAEYLFSEEFYKI